MELPGCDKWQFEWLLSPLILSVGLKYIQVRFKRLAQYLFGDNDEWLHTTRVRVVAKGFSKVG